MHFVSLRNQKCNGNHVLRNLGHIACHSTIERLNLFSVAVAALSPRTILTRNEYSISLICLHDDVFADILNVATVFITCIQ